MKVAFYGGQTAGVVVLLALLAKNKDIRFVIAEDEKVAKLAKIFDLQIKPKKFLDKKNFIKVLKHEVDFLICCHGKKILGVDLVNNLKCINLHPCLYKYKGARPIKRLIEDANPKASVASHWMTGRVDQGKVILEKFKVIHNVKNKTEAEVYNELYPLYLEVISKTLEKLTKMPDK